MNKLKYKKCITLFVLLIITTNLPLTKAEEWQPKATNRQRINFNANWLFFRGVIRDDAAKHPSFKDINWQAVHLPHSPLITILRHPWKLDNEGINWYHKHFQLLEAYRGC